MLVNNKIGKKSTILQPGDCISVINAPIPPISCMTLTAEDIPLDILYEDDFYIALNKPAGMVVHPGNGNKNHTVVNALLYYAKSLSAGTHRARPGIVHRIDKDTSGVLMVAKTDEAHTALSRLFMHRRIYKEYRGICIGKKPLVYDRICASINRSTKNRILFCVSADGKESITDYELLQYVSGISYVAFYPKTGRTHQIRVHAAYKGFPILGDTLYGDTKNALVRLSPFERTYCRTVTSLFARHALHAFKLHFIHPILKKELSITAPLPEDFCNSIKLFPDGSGAHR